MQVVLLSVHVTVFVCISMMNTQFYEFCCQMKSSYIILHVL